MITLLYMSTITTKDETVFFLVATTLRFTSVYHMKVSYLTSVQLSR